MALAFTASVEVDTARAGFRVMKAVVLGTVSAYSTVVGEKVGFKVMPTGSSLLKVASALGSRATERLYTRCVPSWAVTMIWKAFRFIPTRILTGSQADPEATGLALTVIWAEPSFAVGVTVTILSVNPA